MSRKLSLSPDVSYMLGLSTLGKEDPSISVSSLSEEIIERFVRIALNDLGIDARKIIVTEERNLQIDHPEKYIGKYIVCCVHFLALSLKPKI